MGEGHSLGGINPSTRSQLVFLIGLGILFFLPGLGWYELSAPDEPRFALVAREMIDDGQWLLPHRNQRAYPDKPPLFFWSIAAFSLFNGGEVTASTARLPSALAALGGLLLLWWFARDKERRPWASLLPPLVLVSTYLFFFQARMAQIDMLLCFTTTAAAVIGFEALSGGRRRLFLLGMLLGLAILAKGPVGYLVPVGGLCLFCAFQGRPAWRRFPKSALAWGLVPPLVWILTLVIQVWVTGQWDYLNNLLFKQTLVRYLDPWHHFQPFYYFIVTFSHDFLPWTPFFVAAIPFTKAARAALTEKDKFAWAMVLFTLVFFSLSKGKRNLYILPLYPFAAYLTGRFIERALGSDIWTHWKKVPWILVAGLFGLLGLALAALCGGWIKGLVPVWIESPLPIAALLFASLGLVLSAVGIIVFSIKNRAGGAFMSIIAAVLVINLLAYLVIFPWVSPYRSAKRFAIEATQIIETTAGDRAKVAMVDYRSAFRFYGNFPLVELANEKGFPDPGLPKIADFWKAEPEGWIIVRSDDWALFTARDRRATVIELRMPMGRGTEFLLVRRGNQGEPGP